MRRISKLLVLLSLCSAWWNSTHGEALGAPPLKMLVLSAGNLASRPFPEYEYFARKVGARMVFWHVYPREWDVYHRMDAIMPSDWKKFQGPLNKAAEARLKELLSEDDSFWIAGAGWCERAEPTRIPPGPETLTTIRSPSLPAPLEYSRQPPCIDNFAAFKLTVPPTEEGDSVRIRFCDLSDDATGLPSGDSRFFLAWGANVTLDATGLPSGVSRSLQEREPPPGKPVAS